MIFVKVGLLERGRVFLHGIIFHQNIMKSG
jgi:hypothetical protein